MSDTPAPMPAFVCIGVEKCGTTSLHRMLDQHPDVYLGRFKEHFFFNREFDRGIEWYNDRYSTYAGEALVGDITPSYFRNPKSYDRIHSLCGPQVRAILVLRQPLIRAWSHYNHELLRAKFDVGFTETFEHPLIGVDYVKVVERFQQNFGDRGLVLINEDDIAANPLIGAAAVGEHLGIEIGGVESRWSNRGLSPRFLMVRAGETHTIDGTEVEITNDALAFCSRPELSKVTPNPADDVVQAAMAQQQAWTRSLEASDVQPLTASVFGEVVPRLEEQLGRSLIRWTEQLEPPVYELASLPLAKLLQADVIRPPN